MSYLCCTWAAQADSAMHTAKNDEADRTRGIVFSFIR
jgi:hypothetical protein